MLCTKTILTGSFAKKVTTTIYKLSFMLIENTQLPTLYILCSSLCVTIIILYVIGSLFLLCKCFRLIIEYS